MVFTCDDKSLCYLISVILGTNLEFISIALIWVLYISDIH